MKKLLLLLAFTLATVAHGQVTLSRSSTTNNINSGFDLPSGMTITLESGSTFTASAGSTVNLSAATVTLPAGVALPDQSGHSGKFLTTNGSAASWATISATAWDGIGDPSGNGNIAFAATQQSITSTLDNGSVLGVVNTDTDASSDTIIFDLYHYDSADANVFYLKMTSDANGTPDVDFSFSQTAFASRLPITVAVGATLTVPNTGLKLGDTADDHYVQVKVNENQAADRTLNLILGAADRTLTFTDDASIEGTNTGDQDAAGVEVAATPLNYTAATPDVEAHLAGIDTAIGSVAVALADNGEFSLNEAMRAGDERALQSLANSNTNTLTMSGDISLDDDPAQSLGAYLQLFDPDGSDRVVTMHASGSNVLRSHIVKNTGSIGEEIIIEDDDGATAIGTIYAGEFAIIVDFAGDGTWEVRGGGEIIQLPISFDPDAVCDGAVDRLFLLPVDAAYPNGIYITGWSVSFEADPTTEVDLDLKRADAFIGVANSAVMDVLDTTAGVSSETTPGNINSGAVVANGKVVYLEFGTPYTETTHQINFTLRFLKR